MIDAGTGIKVAEDRGYGVLVESVDIRRPRN